MTIQISVDICVLKHGSDLPLPTYETSEAAGMDLRAALPDNPITLKSGDRALIPTAISMALPKGYEAQIRPRSGLAVKNGVTVLNSPGTIDSDYRGEIKIALVNLGQEDFDISHGMRIAQMVIAPVSQANINLVTHLDVTERGHGGFGSTGV